MWLGIDFGTCSFRAAVARGDTLEQVKEPHRLGYTFPSSAYLTEQGELLVGHAADYQRLKDPGRYRREFKRDLGRKEPYVLGDQRLLPENLIAAVLRKLKAEAEQMLHGPVSAAVLTVPATYQEHKRRLMEEAGREAGFETVELLEEPVAAATCYARRGSGGKGLGTGTVVLVYDLGGGTFDAALLRKEVHGYRPLAQPVGLERCGGVDFDRAIFADLRGRCSPALRERLDQQRRDLEALRIRAILEERCRDLKHQLSEAQEAHEMLPAGTLEEYHLTRPAFNALIGPFVEQTLGPCRQLVREAGVRWEQVSGILLVGGGCRIPYVQEVLAKEFGRPLFRVPDPELAASQGAAMDALPGSPEPATSERPRRRKRRPAPALPPLAPLPSTPEEFLQELDRLLGPGD